MIIKNRFTYILNIIFTIIILILSSNLFIKRDISSSYIQTRYSNTEIDIKNRIIWHIQYDIEIEQIILNEFNRLPDNILEKWLSRKTSIILEKPSDFTENQSIAFNKISCIHDEIFSSEIYISSTKDNIKNAILHEMGHYVYAEYFGLNSSYILPNYLTDCITYITEEKNNSTYYTIANEYFADIFAYTIQNGTTDKYKDTYEIERIIKNF